MAARSWRLEPQPGIPFPLGRHVNHDERSRAYRVAADGARKTVRWARRIAVLDQGELGSCTGNAGTGALGTDPNLVGPVKPLVLDEKFAIGLYSAATQIDDAPGSYPPDDTGSDGLSIGKVLKARGLISGYQHAFGINDAYTAIQRGPLLVGTAWTQGMFTPSAAGIVTASGPVVGGHEYECIGYDLTTDLWEFVNSWGTGWGVDGHFFILSSVFDFLLKQQGDIMLLTPITSPAPTPTPAPAPTDQKAAAKAVLDLWSAKKHTGEAAKAAAAWKVYSAPTVTLQ